LEAKAVAIVIAFAALTIVLSAVKIPTLFWPQQNFRLWEIPIVTAFLLFGFRVAFSAVVIGIAGQTALFVGPASILEAPWGLIVVLTMFLGIYLAKKLSQSRLTYVKLTTGIMPIVLFTAFCIIVRASIMLPIDYTIYSSILPIVIGVNIPNAYVIGLMPFTFLFNVLVPLYTVPVSYLLAKTIGNNVKVGNKFSDTC
jgi:hypothetical protein